MQDKMFGLMQKWELCNESARDFCERHDIKEHVFYTPLRLDSLLKSLLSTPVYPSTVDSTKLFIPEVHTTVRDRRVEEEEKEASIMPLPYPWASGLLHAIRVRRQRLNEAFGSALDIHFFTSGAHLSMQQWRRGGWQ